MDTHLQPSSICHLLLLIFRYVGNNENYSSINKDQKNNTGRILEEQLLVCMTNKNHTVLFRHVCKSTQAAPLVIPQVEKGQHSQNQPVMELYDFNLFQIKTSAWMLEFTWALVHHSKYLLSDEFYKIPVIFPKAEGRKKLKNLRLQMQNLIDMIFISNSRNSIIDTEIILPSGVYWVLKKICRC